MLNRIPLGATVLAFSSWACQSEPPVEAEPTEPAAEAAAAEPETAPEPEPEKELPARRFLDVRGTVTLNGQPAQVGTEINDTGTIETGSDGYAVITFMAGHITEIRKSTRLTLGASERKKNSLKLLLGAIWSFLPKGASYEVQTSNAIAGVRGTVFYTETRNDKTSYVCSCDGDIELQAANPKSYRKLVKSSMEHKANIFRTKGKRQKVKKAKRLNHTEVEKMALMEFLEQVK